MKYLEVRAFSWFWNFYILFHTFGCTIFQIWKGNKVFSFSQWFSLEPEHIFLYNSNKKNNQNPNMENIQPFGFIEDPMEINLKTFNNLYFPPYHKPMCVINQILKVFLFSVFDLSVQLRERPNQDIFFLLHWACFVRWNYLLAYFFIWNWLSKHSWIMRIKWKKHWKIMGWWEQEVPCVCCISCKEERDVSFFLLMGKSPFAGGWFWGKQERDWSSPHIETVQPWAELGLILQCPSPAYWSSAFCSNLILCANNTALSRWQKYVYI